jgi:hypothetical protein
VLSMVEGSSRVAGMLSNLILVVEWYLVK